MGITFAEPPISEVVIGKVFSSSAALLVPHYGKFWDLVKEEFPIPSHASPIADRSEGVPQDSETGIPLPRIWFTSEDGTRLLQLQANRFYCNWRQSEKGETYQRFESVYGPYRKYSTVLAAFFASQLGAALVTTRYDLTYVNVFRQGREWNDASDLNGLFRYLRYPPAAALGALDRGATHLEYSMADGRGKVVVSINPAKNTKTEQALIRMELAASGPVRDQSEEAEHAWFDAAHRAIVQGFCDLTSDEAQAKHWKRVS